MNIGIDLGTTFSSVAICYEENGKLVVEEIELASANGETKIPSVIYVKKDGSTVVGAAALNYLATEPDRVFQWFKRDMGGDKPVRTVDGVGWTPEMLSAEILKVLKRDAEKWLEEMGEKLTGTVVCVPAWFGDRQRAATREAIEMAGLTLVDMRAEPSAAALAVAMTRPDEITDRHVLVYDLGGGTFDVVLIKTEKTDSPLPRITTLCRAGHFDLGGHNWDEKLAEHLCQRCFEEHKHNPKNDLREWVTTLERVEAGKRDYSREGEAVMFPVGLRGHAFEISLAEFNEITKELLDETSKMIRNVLAEAAEAPRNVKSAEMVVITCGGASRMPAVAPMLTELVGHQPLALGRLNPERLVVQGAAYAAHLAATPATPTPDGEVRDRIIDQFRAVGIETYGGEDAAGKELWANDVIIPEGAVAGRHYTAKFQTVEGDDDMVLTVYQGADADPAKCEKIGLIVLTEPTMKVGDVLLVSLWYDTCGILDGNVVNTRSGTEGYLIIVRQNDGFPRSEEDVPVMPPR